MSCELTSNPLKLIRCPFMVLIGAATISFFALAAAFASEAFFGLEPCILCIYQRWPFALVIMFGIVGVALKKLIPAMLGLSALSMFVNSGIAFYHTGVEQKWWVSGVDGCKVPLFDETPQTMLENILSAPTARCDEIPWVDPILGLSMANYNVLLCGGLALICAFSVYLLRHTKKA